MNLQKLYKMQEELDNHILENEKVCQRCNKELNSWDKKVGRILGYTLCEECIAKEYSISVQEFRERMEEYLGMRPCQGI